MKKIYLGLIILAVFLFAFPCFAQWSKDSHNPVLHSSESWEKGNLSAPAVIFEEGKFKMWYSDFGGPTANIDYAESTDGVHWQKRKAPVITPYQTDIDAHEPTVIHNGSYKIWYNAQAADGHYKIRYGQSSDGINWSIRSDFVLVGDPHSWEQGNITNPEVVFVNNKYYMWYVAGPPWNIGLATSLDGITWQKYADNPLSLPKINFYGAPSVIYVNNEFSMWYHIGNSAGINSDIYYAVSSDGINWQCKNSDCSVLHYGPAAYDSCGITAPEVIKRGAEFYLWYGGSNCHDWQISLATFRDPDFEPLVILPGLFASWNGKAILHNESVGNQDWQIPAFITEYNGLINSLDNLGFKQNSDYFIFPYDWRDHITHSANNLKAFLDESIWNSDPNKKVRLIGHSLGGMVARIFTQNYQSKVGKLVTVGSPHQGAVQVYKPLAAGEIDRENTFRWLAEKTILVLNKDDFESDKETIQKKFPVAFDLFPIFDFLKDGTGNYIPTASLTIKNDVLNTYKTNFADIYGLTTFIYGHEANNTLSSYTINPPSVLDNVLGIYADGRPISEKKDTGDGTVLAKSATNNFVSNSVPLSFDHGGLIYQKEAIEKIFDTLGLNYTDNEIIPGKKTVISPSLIFFLKSPVSLKISHEGQTYQSNDGLLFIPNAQEGNYQINLIANGLGDYTLYVGQITPTEDIWDVKRGEITRLPSTSQYNRDFSLTNPQPFFPSPTLTSTPTLTPTPTATLTPSPTLVPTKTPTPTSTLALTLTSSAPSSSTPTIISPSPSPYYSSSLAYLPKKEIATAPQVLGEKTEKINNKQDNNRPKKQLKPAVKKTVSLSTISLVVIIMFGLAGFVKRKTILYLLSMIK